MKVLQIETWINEFNPEEINLEGLKEYLDFIKEASERYDSSRYSEWHHVMPRFSDKEKKYSNEGVRINGADHFIAHLKLTKVFNGILKSKSCYSLMRMKNNVTSNNEEISPEDWEYAVKLYTEARSVERRKLKGDKIWNYGKKYCLNLTDDQRRKRSEMMKGNTYGKLAKHYSLYGSLNPFYGKNHTDESKRKISESRRGELNPCYNKIWITNGEHSLRVSESDFESYESQGYYRGRLVSKKARENMSKSSKNRERDKGGRFK